MRKLIKVVSVILVIASVYGFKSAGKEKNKKEIAGWDGVYKGVQKDGGEEVVFVLFLKTDLTYVLQSKGKRDSVPTVLNGNLSWNKAGDEVTLESSENKHKIVYKKNGDVLEVMKVNKKSVAESERYQLQKIDLQEIADKYWKLIEVEGSAVEGSYLKEPHIFLKKEESSLSGSSECNTFNGRYNIEKTNQIKFFKIAASMTACLNMEIETKLFRTLHTADNYTISKDGQYLSLNKAKTTLARFEVDYFK